MQLKNVFSSILLRLFFACLKVFTVKKALFLTVKQMPMSVLVEKNDLPPMMSQIIHFKVAIFA